MHVKRNRKISEGFVFVLFFPLHDIQPYVALAQASRSVAAGMEEPSTIRRWWGRQAYASQYGPRQADTHIPFGVVLDRPALADIPMFRPPPRPSGPDPAEVPLPVRLLPGNDLYDMISRQLRE